MCRGKIPEESEGNIQDVRSLIKELVSRNILGYDRLDILKGILNEIEKSDLVKEVEEFEEQRNQEDEIERKEDEFQRRKAQAAAVVSSVGNTLIGVLNIKTVLRVVAGGITVVSTLEVLSRWSTFDQLVTAVNSCVLPAGTSLVQLTDGCVCLTVRAETLSALTTLWKLHQDGTLETRLYDFFVTDEVRERAGGEEVEVNVTIEEQEYEKACRELSDEAQEAASSDAGERIRRNSDSAVYFRPKKEPTLIKLKHAETELKFHKERIAVIEREIEKISPEILEACSPEEKTAFLKRQNEIWKGHEAGKMEERTDDPGKYALIQKYLQDVQETRSMTTETSDSGLVTHISASEFGMEELISETNKLYFKDLSGDVIRELVQRLKADEGAALKKFQFFFGIKMLDQYPITDIIRDFFPDTTVNTLKECFETLHLYDVAELLEKVRPRSLRPAISPEEIEKLRGEDDRPTKYHSNVAVLIIKHTDKLEKVEREIAEKIEAFFRNLNSQNEVTIISLEEIDEVLKEIEKMRSTELFSVMKVENIRQQLQFHMLGMPTRSYQLPSTTIPELSFDEIEQREKERKQALHDNLDMAAKLRKQIERDVEKLKRETRKAVSTAMEKWIHNREKVSCFAVFVICDGMLFGDYIDAVLDECVVEKLALIPGHAKLVVSPNLGKRIGTVPETLYVMFPADERPKPLRHQFHSTDESNTSVFSWMIEIFNKRWQRLDLISMMQELQRTHYTNCRKSPVIIQDNFSSRPRFQKTEKTVP